MTLLVKQKLQELRFVWLIREADLEFIEIYLCFSLSLQFMLWSRSALYYFLSENAYDQEQPIDLESYRISDGAFVKS